MSEAIEALLNCQTVKEFAKLFKEREKEFDDPLAFAAPLAHYLSRRVYERYYDDEAPHSFFALASAVNTLPCFPEERKWWPIVQQTWFAANSRRRNPWTGNGAGEKAAGKKKEDLLELYRQGLEEADFTKVWTAAESLISSAPDSRDWFRNQSLKLCLDDTFEDGIKLLFLDQCWQLAEKLEWEDPAGILFPALHYVTLAPRDLTLSQLSRKQTLGNHLLAQKKEVSDEDYPPLERRFLFADTVEQGLEVMSEIAQQGVGWQGCWNFLELAAAQMVGNAKPGRWTAAVRSFLYGHTARELCARLDENVRTRILTLTTALVAQASITTREADENRDLETLAQALCPTDTFNTLRSVVSHSDPFASANAVAAILGMDESRHPELFNSLATLAAKNEGHQGRGYDLLLVQAAVDCYRNSESAHRRKFLMNCAFVLGRMPKSYELFGAYGV